MLSRLCYSSILFKTKTGYSGYRKDRTHGCTHLHTFCYLQTDWCDDAACCKICFIRLFCICAASYSTHVSSHSGIKRRWLFYNVYVSNCTDREGTVAPLPQSRECAQACVWCWVGGWWRRLTTNTKKLTTQAVCSFMYVPVTWVLLLICIYSTQTLYFHAAHVSASRWYIHYKTSHDLGEKWFVIN